MGVVHRTLAALLLRLGRVYAAEGAGSEEPGADADTGRLRRIRELRGVSRRHLQEAAHPQ